MRFCFFVAHTFRDKVLDVWVIPLQLLHVWISQDSKFSEHDSLGPDLLGESACVDAMDGGDVVLLEPCREGLDGPPVAVLLVVGPHNQSGDVDLG